MQTFFFLLRGAKRDLLRTALSDLPSTSCKVLWAGTGDWVIDPAFYAHSPVRSYRPWDLALVLEFPADDEHPEAVGAGMDRFVMEVRTETLHPSKAERKAAERFDPEHEPEGVWGIIGPVYILRNFSRGASILSWALRNALRRTLLQPFHMINLLKFRAPGGQQTYDLYRDAAAGVVMREGGGLAYMGAAVAPEKAGFDEVMIVKYKSRFQFFHMALLDWHYWPLIFLRDEGLADGVLHASIPIDVKQKAA